MPSPNGSRQDCEITVSASGPYSLFSLASSDETGTYSLSASLEDYPFINGRRYHSYKEGSYPFPNDEVEQRRMNWQFRLIKRAQGGRLFFAPVANPKMILDVGTGTGIWAIELADSGLVPNALITGIDLSPIQPRDVPPNVTFELQDCSESDWVRDLDSIDLVYCQNLFGSLSDYHQFLINARRYLVPGHGWIECCELDVMPLSDDNTIPPDWTLKLWADQIAHSSEVNGKPFRVAPKLRQWMIDGGYVDVQEIISKIPIGSWPANKELKSLGREWKAIISATLSVASAVVFEKALGWSIEESEIVCAQTRESLKRRGIHAYMKIHTVYGRRPSEQEARALNLKMGPPPLPSRR